MSAQDSVASPPQGLETVSVKRPGFLASVARDKKAVVGIVILTILVLSGIFATWLAPYDPNNMDYDMIGEPS